MTDWEKLHESIGKIFPGDDKKVLRVAVDISIKGLCYDDPDHVVPCECIPDRDCINKEYWRKSWATCELGAKCEKIFSICMYCRRPIHGGTRGPNGEISHGICPECFKSKHPDVLLDSNPEK